MATESGNSRVDAPNGRTRDKLRVFTWGRESRLGRHIRRTPCGYDVLRLAMAIVLLAAAGLKAYQLMAEPVLETDLLGSRWFLIGEVEIELCFGLWLLSTFLPVPSVRRARGEDSFPRGPESEGILDGGRPSLPLSRNGCRGNRFWMWFASIGLFSSFGCVSLWKAIVGKTTCGCFGTIQVNPRYTATLDFAIAILMLFCPPRGDIVRSSSQRTSIFHRRGSWGSSRRSAPTIHCSSSDKCNRNQANLTSIRP